MSDPNPTLEPKDSQRMRRRQRRSNFLQALRQSQTNGHIPVVNVGQSVRERRTERGFTIRELAQKSGLNVNTLSMIENGKASPSVETLQQLSFALEIPIATFFEEKNTKKKIVHFKSSQRHSVGFSCGTLEDLGTGMPPRGAETFLVTLNPNSNSGENPIVHTGRETVFCLEGQLTYIIDNQSFMLEPGDSLCFESHLPHRWLNTGAIPARSLLVLCPSDEKDRPTEMHFTQEIGHV